MKVSPLMICLFVSALRINIVLLKNICKNPILILRPILLRALVSLSLSLSRSMGLTKISLGESLFFSKNKNNAFNNNNKPKDTNLGNEVFCFVCGQANHLAKNCFQHHCQPTSFPKPQACCSCWR